MCCIHVIDADGLARPAEARAEAGDAATLRMRTWDISRASSARFLRRLSMCVHMYIYIYIYIYITIIIIIIIIVLLLL